MGLCGIANMAFVVLWCGVKVGEGVTLFWQGGSDRWIGTDDEWVFMGDIYGDHAVSCDEVDIGLGGGSGKSLRPADVLLYSWDVGRDVCVDLTGSSPLTQTGMVDFVPGRAVTEAAQRKRVKYEAKCADIGYSFLPFSFSSFGELEKDAVTLLKRIRKFSMAQDIGAHQEIAKGVEILLSQKSFNSLHDVVHHLSQKLGFDLSHKIHFIRDHIYFLLRSSSQPTPQPPLQPPPPPQQQFHHHFTQQQQQQLPQHVDQQFHPHPLFALPQQQVGQVQRQRHPVDLNFGQGVVGQQVQVLPLEVKTEGRDVGKSNEKAKKGGAAGTKRRGGPGGLNKLCGITPELQVIVGESALSRTDIVKQLWAYIKKNNLQDPGNKRKIICDDALRVLFETDCTDMFKMNKLLAKHIIRLEPTKESSRKKSKVKTDPEDEPVAERADNIPSHVIISDALANCLGTGEREMSQSEALRLVWEYIKVNNLEDPKNPVMILCDEKLKELFGCESISAMGIPELLVRNHLFKQ
nr:hypothetical protein [Tanacetum cinerariifolium]